MEGSEEENLQWSQQMCTAVVDHSYQLKPCYILLCGMHRPLTLLLRAANVACLSASVTGGGKALPNWRLIAEP